MKYKNLKKILALMACIVVLASVFVVPLIVSAEEPEYYEGYEDGYADGMYDALGKAECQYNADIETTSEYEECCLLAEDQGGYEYSGTDYYLFIRGFVDYKLDLGFHYSCCAENNNIYYLGLRAALSHSYYESGFENGYLEAWEPAYSEGFTEGYQEGKNTNIGLKEKYEEGYKDGKAEGYNEGYNECYEEQKAKNNTHIFAEATYTAHVFADYFTGAGEQKIASITFEPNRYQNSIDFANLLDILNNSNIDTKDYYLDEILTRVEIEINWPTEKAFDLEKFPIYIYGTTDVNYGTITNTNNKTYAINANPEQNTRKFVVEEAGANIKQMVKRMTIRVGRASDLLSEFTLLSESEAYNVGYNEGYESGSENGASTGYQEGYSNGFMQGKAEGLTLKENSNWRELMNAIVEAPVNTFRSLFNFEILGLDMRAAFGSILALCMILIIIKKVIL